ncbi:hypothetical protein J3F83DRAFT_766995 [Trichoderma novae-zelandiae]
MQNGTKWHGLPLEIRRSILMVLIRDKHPGWASLASVCTEWQSVIERENLRRITLEGDQIHQLQRMITQERRDRVEQIHLDVSLLLYGCELCQEPEDLMDIGLNTGLVIASLYRLLRVLSAWPSRPPGRGVRLELNAYSDSDNMHWYRHYYYGSPFERLKSDIGPHDPSHGWIDGSRTQTGLPNYIFVIRRSFRRCIIPSVMKQILQNMPCLEEFIYEPWRTWYYAFDVMVQRYPELDMDIDPPDTGIRKLVIFENVNDELSIALNEAPSFRNFQDQVFPPITEAFAWASREYEDVWVSLLFDAKVFFSKCYENYTWWRLRSLCLTSPVLDSTRPVEAATLIHDAAKVALRMPWLQTLVLWNGEQRGEACAFIYRKSDAGPSITWRGTWDIDLHLTSEIVEAWKSVVSQTCWRDLCLCFERVEEEIRFLGDAIYYLRLPCQVIEPQSLWEMRREERTIVSSSLAEVE